MHKSFPIVNIKIITPSADYRYMAFESYQNLFNFMLDNGVIRVLIKELSENDNSKQQIYLGSSFESLNQLPFEEITNYSGLKTQNFKATLDYWWINDDSNFEQAKSAQLILYTKYPEVRLSGFLKGCKAAPSQHMKAPTPYKRTGGPDGRFLFLGITREKRIIAYLATPSSSVARSLRNSNLLKKEPNGVFIVSDLIAREDSEKELVRALGEISALGWQKGQRLNSNGELIGYNSPNAGGYTLESLLGILPNGIPGPDMLGWEVKAFSGDRITLMTPEPDQGEYVDNGIEYFLRTYGHQSDKNTLYFTGLHRCSVKAENTRLTLVIRGFDSKTLKITDTDGGLYLVSDNDNIAAKWSFPGLINHWSKKHNRAVFVPFIGRKTTDDLREFLFSNSIHIGKGTDFTLFLNSLFKGFIYYDPGTRMRCTESQKTEIKKRNQFRIPIKYLDSLYFEFKKTEL